MCLCTSEAPGHPTRFLAGLRCCRRYGTFLCHPTHLSFRMREIRSRPHNRLARTRDGRRTRAPGRAAQVRGHRASYARERRSAGEARRPVVCLLRSITMKCTSPRGSPGSPRAPRASGGGGTWLQPAAAPRASIHHVGVPLLLGNSDSATLDTYFTTSRRCDATIFASCRTTFARSESCFTSASNAPSIAANGCLDRANAACQCPSHARQGRPPSRPQTCMGLFLHARRRLAYLRVARINARRTRSSAAPRSACSAQTQPASARRAHVRADPLPSADPFGLISPRPSTHRVSTCSWAQCASNAPIDSTALDLQRAQRTGNCGAPFSPRLSGAVRPFLRVALRV